jgi:hypothetical protein
MPFEIMLLKTDSAILLSCEVMCQLRPDIKKSDYLSLIRMQENKGYNLVSLSEAGQILSAAGFRFCRSLGWGKYLYVDDLVTDASKRSKGAGKALFDWLVDRAGEAECAELRLDSALWRNERHRFFS